MEKVASFRVSTKVLSPSLLFFNFPLCQSNIISQTVREVKSIRLADEEENEVANNNTLQKGDNQGPSGLNSEYENYIHNVVQDRTFMARHCIRQGKDGRYSRYAIKSMLEICKQDPSMFVNTVVDIAIEAKFLSVVRHPNIIKMRATSAGDICSSNSFLVS